MNLQKTNCSVCETSDAFFFRPYSGEKLCKKCFVKTLEDKVRATVAEYKMLRFDGRVAVAVSGGKDSISLLHILAKMTKRHPNSSLVAVTVDEGIKGYRDEALKIAKDNCIKLELEHHVTSFKKMFGLTLDEIVEVKRRKGANSVTICAYCGVLRRKMLNIVARDVGADRLATAHTLDDEIQTTLLNLFNGNMLGLAREKPVTDEVHQRFVRRIKPFCEIPERETALYAFLRKFRFQNRPCPYASVAMRNDVRAFLNRMEKKHTGIKFSIFRSIQKVRPALEELNKESGLADCVECGEPTSKTLCRTCQMLRQMGVNRNQYPNKRNR